MSRCDVRGPAAGLAASSRARTCSGVIVPPFWPAPLPMTALLLGHRPFFCTLSGGAYSRRGSARGSPPHNTDAAKNTKPATYVKHTLDVVKPRDEEQYDSVQIKAIYTTAKGGWICCVTFTYVYLCCASIFMNIPDNAITPTLFCQKWIFHWKDVEIEHILRAIIIGLESEPDLDSLNNEQRGKNAKLDFPPFSIYTYKSSHSGICARTAGKEIKNVLHARSLYSICQ